MRYYLLAVLFTLSSQGLKAQTINYPDSVIRGGSMRQGELRRVNFKVQNAGTETAYLIVEPGMEDFALDTYRFALPAGATRTIYMRFRAPAKTGLLEIPMVVKQVSSPLSPDIVSASKTLYLRALISSESNIFPSNKTGVKFGKMSHDFGTVEQGKQIQSSFTIHNTDTLPLVIESVKTNCGCLTAKYSFQPIAPGKSGEVVLTFHSERRHGRFNNGAHISFVSGSSFFVSLAGSVETKEEMSAFR